MRDRRRLRDGEKKRVADEEGKGWRNKDTGGDLACEEGNGKGKDEGFREKDTKTAVAVKNEQLRKRGKRKGW